MTQTEPIITSLSHVVGQQRAVTVLRTALDAYWHDRSKHGDKEALPRQTIEMFERDFIRLGLINKCDKGRALTPRGVEHVNGPSA